MDLKCELKSLLVEKAGIQDIRDILMIEKECGLSKWKLEDYFKEINRKSSLVLIAKINKRTIGFLMARSVINEIDILNIGVSPKYRKAGIGSSLLNNLLSNIYGTTIESIWLEVRESNSNAIGFYRKKGFAPIQIRKNFYTHPVENAIVMRRELENLVSKSCRNLE